MLGSAMTSTGTSPVLADERWSERVGGRALPSTGPLRGSLRPHGRPMDRRKDSTGEGKVSTVTESVAAEGRQDRVVIACGRLPLMCGEKRVWVRCT